MEDAEAAARLATQLGYPATTDEIRRRLQALSESDDATVFVAEDPQGGAVGWVHVFGRLLLESDPDAEIGGLVVDERLRGRGIGKALMASAEAWARERGYGVVSLRTNVIRTEAHEFYKALGYEVIKSQLKLRKRL
jgi:GNAT superfamily N-acetyltransferase